MRKICLNAGRPVDSTAVGVEVLLGAGDDVGVIVAVGVSVADGTGLAVGSSNITGGDVKRQPVRHTASIADLMNETNTHFSVTPLLIRCSAWREIWRMCYASFSSASSAPKSIVALMICSAFSNIDSGM